MKAQVEVNIQIRLLAVILRNMDLIFGGGERLLFSKPLNWLWVQ
jgi:hypothetical protein